MSAANHRQRPLPPSGAQHTIRLGEQVATVTEVGACLRDYRVGQRAIIDGYDEAEMCPRTAGMPLLPWPNRIDGGRYQFDGESHQLPIDRVMENNAIHGLSRWSAWHVLRLDRRRVVMGLHLAPRPGYPFHLMLRVGYALTAQGLEVAIHARNAGHRRLPFGAGHHPYFLPKASVDTAVLHVSARRCVEFDERWLPTEERDVAETAFDFRTPLAIGARLLAHSYTDLTRDRNGRIHVLLDDLDVWAGEGFRWMLVYTGDDAEPPRSRRSVAIEPMTCPPNAFASGRDVLVLEPGEDINLKWGVRLTRPVSRSPC